MKKKFISAIVAASVAAAQLSAFADYYPKTEFPNVTIEDVNTQHINIDDFKRVANSVRSSAANNNLIQLENDINTLFSYIKDEQAAYSMAYLNASQHNTEANNKEVAELYTDLTIMSEILSDLMRDLYNTDTFRNALILVCRDQEVADEFINSLPNERFYELSEQENKLINEYHNNAFGSLEYHADNNQTYTLTMLYDALQAAMADDNLYSESGVNEYLQLYSYYTDYIKQSGAVLGDIFKKLVDVRTKEAIECGYSNYADYAYNEIYYRDYSLENTAVFRENVKKYICSIQQDNEAAQPLPLLKTLDDTDIVQKISDNIGYVSPELKESFDYLVKQGFYDISRNDDRTTPGTAYTTLFGDFPVPFIFISPYDNDNIKTLKTFVHEFGHFNALFRKNLSPQNEFGIMTELLSDSENIDIQEIYSQGLELLFSNRYGRVFGSNAEFIRTELLQSMIGAVVLGCLYDEWQETVYKNPQMSVDEINALYNELSKEYGITNVDYAWVTVPHNFESPMYYISYATSAAAALDIWVQSNDDYSSAVDKYMRLSADNDNYGFCDTLANYGFDDIFEENTVSKIANSLTKYFCHGYTDIDKDKWYYQYLLSVSPYLDDAQRTQSFRADDYVLRSEMGNTIGKFYEYFDGDITDANTSFVDTSNSRYISWAADNDILKGYNAEVFGADDTLTREQAVTILYRYCSRNGIPVYENEAPDFYDDNDISQWASEAVEWASALGIITGIQNEYGNMLFCPQSYLTRAELSALMYRLSVYLDSEK